MSVTKDEVIEALRGLSPEQLHGILQQGYGRSPVRQGPLSDLTKRPSAKDPRPTFFTVEPEDQGPVTHSLFPRLYWHKDTGREITVKSEADLVTLGSMFVDKPPRQAPIDPVEAARQLFESLSEEDQAFLLDQQRQSRVRAAALHFSTLSESQAAQAMSGAAAPAPTKKPKAQA